MARITPLLLLLLAFAAEAATPDPIQGCINARGRLRIVTDTSLCRDTETPIELAPAGAASPARFQLVGFTTATFDGDEGILGFTVACQSEFADSRMCRSQEVLNTVSVPAGLPGKAWVRPSRLGGSGTTIEGAGFSHCTVWTVSVTGNGLTANAEGKLTEELCDSLLAVACCALVP